jgi:hypothetical protein
MEGNEQQRNILIWIARICGLFVSLIWLGITFSGAVEDYKMTLSIEGILGTVLVILPSIGVVIAWKYPMNGGKIIIISSIFLIIFHYFSSEVNKYIPIAIQGLPFFLVGIFFIQSHLGKENNP